MLVGKISVFSPMVSEARLVPYSVRCLMQADVRLELYETSNSNRRCCSKISKSLSVMSMSRNRTRFNLVLCLSLNMLMKFELTRDKLFDRTFRNLSQISTGKWTPSFSLRGPVILHETHIVSKLLLM
jgi:hypothetical protein